MAGQKQEEEQKKDYNTKVTASDPAKIYELYLKFYKNKGYDDKKAYPHGKPGENPIHLSFNSPEEATKFMKLAAEQGLKFRVEDEQGNVLAHSNGDGELYQGAAVNGKKGTPFQNNEIISAPSNTSPKADNRTTRESELTNSKSQEPSSSQRLAMRSK